MFGSNTGFNQSNSGLNQYDDIFVWWDIVIFISLCRPGSNLFGELANQAGQQQSFGALTTAGAQGSVFGSGQQIVFGNSGSSEFGQSGGGSVFGSGQVQAMGQFGAGTQSSGGDLFGSQQPFSGTSPQ